MDDTLNSLQEIIGQDAGNRGMKHLIVPGDLAKASRILGTHHYRLCEATGAKTANSVVLILSGFPCCVTETPPTETDGPPGACAIARAALELGNRVILVTDECNGAVFQAAAQDLLEKYERDSMFSIQTFPSIMDEDDTTRLKALYSMDHSLIIAIERAGPSSDGACYTMRGIDMSSIQLTAPLHEIVSNRASHSCFIAIGDGGNELGMGKVFDKVQQHIPNGEKVGCVIEADLLIAASVSNWGGYALAAGAALVRAEACAMEQGCFGDLGRTQAITRAWMERCLPTEQEEIQLIDRCVRQGCRDGVTGLQEATVDGMPLETSLQCLRDICRAACID